MKLTVEQAAYGMFTIVNHNMVNGIRRVSVERGFDPRDFVLVGAGGATAAHITALAREIGVETIILPKLASGLCAFGQIISDVKYNYMATSPARLDNKEAYARLNRKFKELEQRGVAHLIKDGFPKSRISVKRSLEMRYVGQVHDCTVDIETFDIGEKTIDRIKEAFHRRHEELYTYSERHSAVEVVNLESTLKGLIDKPKTLKLKRGGTVESAGKGFRKAIFAASGKAIKTAVYDGERLGAGAVVVGPAIIEEVTTTIVIEPGWTASLHESGSYVITRVKARKRK